MTGAYDLDEAIARVRAFAAVGADCVYVMVPGGEAALAQVVVAVSVPVNALAVGPLAQLGGARFAALGVARISLGSALARMTHRVIYDAAQAMLGPVISGEVVEALLLKGAR